MIAPPSQLAGNAVEILALFAEARRRRRRRRRIAGAAASLVLAASAVIGLSIGGRHHDPAHRAAASARPPAVIAKPNPARFTLPAARVAWAAFGQLHIGDVATLTQRVAATGVGGFVRAGGQLFWSGSGSDNALIRDYGIATGKIRYLVRGMSVFASADGRHVYIVQTDTKVIEMPAAGSGAKRMLRVPVGWYLSYNHMGVAGGGIVVNANDDRGRPAPVIAVWFPRTGQMKIIGSGIPAAAVTPPGARQSLLAWTPDSCRLQDCPIEITNISTLDTVTVRNPLHHGFTEAEGVFSPGGRSLAAFARRASLNSNRANRSELAIINTRTGTLRLVPAARLVTQEDAGWAVWLPGGQRLLVGALSYSYAVNAKTLAARGFFFFPGAARTYGDHNIMTSGDVNFSTTVLPPARPDHRPGITTVRRPFEL